MPRDPEKRCPDSESHQGHLWIERQHFGGIYPAASLRFWCAGTTSPGPQFGDRRLMHQLFDGTRWVDLAPVSERAPVPAGTPVHPSTTKEGGT